MNLVEDQEDFIAKVMTAIEQSGVPSQVVVDLEDTEEGVEISYIEVPEDLQGQGLGDKVLAILTHHADQQNVTLWLTAADEELEDWYWKHGFTGGRHMVRKPQRAE